VVAVGCLAERYGSELATALPEADAIIGFDGYDQIAATVRTVLAGGRPAPHRPRDRRSRPALPLVERSTAPAAPWLPSRLRLDNSPVAPLKIASGCDRRCTFCAIPAFRGAFVSRASAEIVAEADWLAHQGVKELFLVSENTTSYGTDVAQPRALAELLARLAEADGIVRIRLSYLQPAEVKPWLIDAIANTDKVAPYFDLPFQHAAGAVLRRMGRFGDATSFLDLIARIRATVPLAGIRSNVIVGFPGETEGDIEALIEFLGAADLDAVGVFGYSDEEGTEAATLDGQLDQAEIDARAGEVRQLADTFTAARAADRIGQMVEVLVGADEDGRPAGHAGQQGPEDGRSYLTSGEAEPGRLVTGRIGGADGVDWLVEPV